MYDELSLTEISYNLQYSSVAHLPNQFKKVTGITPTYFKRNKNKKRKSLEDL
jgi:AraC-like DNA-binding protein